MAKPSRRQESFQRAHLLRLLDHRQLGEEVDVSQEVYCQSKAIDNPQEHRRLRDGEDVLPLGQKTTYDISLLYTPSTPRDATLSRMPSSA